LNIRGPRRIFADMKLRALLPMLALALAAAAAPASAACYADYKAKRDAPLQLHYGVIQLPDAACNPQAAAPVIAQRIGRDGWQLLAVVSVFDEAGLEARRDSAGAYFLRY
jgi:hypothetical protein